VAFLQDSSTPLSIRKTLQTVLAANAPARGPEKSLSAEYRMVAPDGSVIVGATTRSALVRGSDGTPQVWQGVLIDISESRRAHRSAAGERSSPAGAPLLSR